jgi:CubicO group peptidase (beta-lactamase class C family)
MRAHAAVLGLLGCASLAAVLACAPVTPSPRAPAAPHELAAEAITLVRDVASRLPLDPRLAGSVTLVVHTAPQDTVSGRMLAHELREIYGEVRVVRTNASLDAKRQDVAVDAARRSEAVLFVTVVPRGRGRTDRDLPPDVVSLYRRLEAAHGHVIGVAFGDAAGIAALKPATLLLAGEAGSAVAESAAARAIAGLNEITGRARPPGLSRGAGMRRDALDFALATALPEHVGMSSTALQKVDGIIEAALLDGAAPGAAIAVGRRGRLVMLRGYGATDVGAGFNPVTDSTIYDLASLTKVVATTTLAMMLVDEGRLDLDAPVSDYLVEWRAGGSRDRVTARHLLLHNSGLPAYDALYRELRGREAYARRIGTIALQYEPGSRTVYSDFGLILLGLIIERLTGSPLDELFARRIAEPLGLRDTGFDPLTRVTNGDAAEPGEAAGPGVFASDALRARIAPTEIDRTDRGTHLHGVVHDENAHALGGVAGHAGLFGSARDLARFAQLLLDGGFLDGSRHIRRATVLEFTRRHGEASSRALGWDTPAGASSSAGDYFSARSFGHTGFTGTSIWVDPERELFVVLLTNRVNPTRENQRHIGLRRAVADAVQHAVIDAPPTRRPGT